MTKAQLLKKIARLESLNDHLSAEVNYIDKLMRLIGFVEGIESLKITAQDLVNKGPLDSNDFAQ